MAKSDSNGRVFLRRLVAGSLLLSLLPACSFSKSSPSVPNDQENTASQPAFSPKSSVQSITPEQAAKMRNVTLRDFPGCATVDQLQIVQVPYRNFDNANAIGSLVVRKEIAAEVGEIFEGIYTSGFRIELIALPEAVTDKKSGDPKVGVEIDNELMAKNITSGFNCRTLDGKVDKHGLGRAIDINPLQNPMIEPNPFTSPRAKRFTYSPPAAEGKWDKNPEPEKLLSYKSKQGGQVIALFKQHGWRWGGDFVSLYDGQHFDKAK